MGPRRQLHQRVFPRPVQSSEAAGAGNQLRGGSVFDNPPGLHHQDAIGDGDGRQTVGDDDCRAAGQQLGETGSDLSGLTTAGLFAALLGLVGIGAGFVARTFRR